MPQKKGVPLDVVQTFPGGEDPVFRVMSPFGKVPAFSDGAAPDASAYPKLLAYRDTIVARPSFAPIIATEREILGLAS